MKERKRNAAAPARKIQYKRQSQLKEIWKRLMKNKAAIVGLIIIVLILLMACFADVLYDYDEMAIKQNILERLQSPSAKHPFGTDDLGRDILARIVHGSRTSLLISFFAVLVSLVVGGVIGSIAGYFGGAVDNVLMRIMDVFLAIPGLLFAITIVAAFGTSTINLIMALSVVFIPGFSRIVRGSVMTVRNADYVEAARAVGAKNLTLILGHVIPNSLAPVLVHATLNIAVAVIITAGMSFLGLGIQAPTPEWGAMLSGSRSFIRDYSYMTIFPGLAIMVTILALNLLGDGLRDALDPRLK